MPLMDKLEPLTENPICPRCSMPMDFTSRSRSEDGKYDALKYECPICHVRERITTRNNVRMEWSLLFAVYGTVLAFALGVAVEALIAFKTKTGT